MSKETDMKQMSLLGDSPVNHSQSQGKGKEQMTTDISGMKLLESSENVNPDGLLGKTLKVLLTSKTAWYSDRCKMTWKKKVSKSGVLLFQLAAKVHGTNAKESGFLGTPTTTMSPRSKAFRTENSAPTPAEYAMLPTPTVGCEEGGEQSSRVEQTKSGGFILRKKNNPNMTYGAKLSDAMLYLEKKMYPTPRVGGGSRPNQKGGKCLDEEVMIENGLRERGKKLDKKLGGKLNPEFVEFLMGYPMNWTKIEPNE